MRSIIYMFFIRIIDFNQEKLHKMKQATTWFGNHSIPTVLPGVISGLSSQLKIRALSSILNTPCSVDGCRISRDLLVVLDFRRWRLIMGWRALRSRLRKGIFDFRFFLFIAFTIVFLLSIAVFAPRAP